MLIVPVAIPGHPSIGDQWPVVANDAEYPNEPFPKLGTLPDDVIASFIDSTVALLDEAKTRNFKKWNILGHYVWPNPVITGSYENEIFNLKNWVTARLKWIDENIQAEYSFIEWADPVKNVLVSSPGNPANLKLTDIQLFPRNVTSTIYVSSDKALVINRNSSNIELQTLSEGTYNFWGFGFYNGNLVEISPRYTVTNVTSVSDYSNQPSEYQLYQNFPNPFNPRTVIKFQVPSSKFIKLQVYDLLGGEIQTLANEYKLPGTYEVAFNADGLPSGIYFYSLRAGDFSDTKKMILLR
ncbi:MAG: T9SS type A sorting domain-containing protein [Bacteroidetes bacterium]|nr:T9SS type A sorting domain-containing protein [Bacteroidota bacterium]